MSGERPRVFTGLLVSSRKRVSYSEGSTLLVFAKQFSTGSIPVPWVQRHAGVENASARTRLSAAGADLTSRRGLVGAHRCPQIDRRTVPVAAILFCRHEPNKPRLPNHGPANPQNAEVSLGLVPCPIEVRWKSRKFENLQKSRCSSRVLFPKAGGVDFRDLCPRATSIPRQ
jgi:hypothetical protein